MPHPKKLIVAIDETGQFKEQKLLGTKGRTSGMVAVISSWPKKRLVGHLERLAGEHGLRYPDHFHAMEILIGSKRRALGLDMKQAEAEATVAAMRAGMREALDTVVGVRGRLAGRLFFNEQQAWGEMLLALLHHVGEFERERLEAADEVWIYLASRRQDELVGFTDPDEYHDDLARYLELLLRRGAWPESTKVVVDSATKDPYLMVADFHAAALGRSAQEWSTDLDDLHLPANWDAATTLLRRVDRASVVMMQLAGGEEVSPKVLLRLEEQALHEALRRLTAMAHGLVANRHGRGDMELALRIADHTWVVAQRCGTTAVMGELCTIAAEVASHRGLTADAPDVVRWRERAESLPDVAWASNVLAAQAARLEHRCQTVQLDSFNVFDFDGVYLEFTDHLAEYEARAGGREALEESCDELYGKLLGTMGQACGFLRAQDEDIGADARAFLERSRPHFEHSSPLFQAMNLGFRLTDLWDRGELDAAAALMEREGVPDASKADAYSLLHRLRIASARSHAGLDHEPIEPIRRRLLVLARDRAFPGATPHDLCLEWALWLMPDDSELRSAARRWLSGLDAGQVAIVATSLPLLLQLGEHERGRHHVESLLSWSGFAAHWQTERAAALARCLADGTTPDFDALRGMPWNYA